MTRADNLAGGLALWYAGASFGWYVPAPWWIWVPLAGLAGWLAGQRIGATLPEHRRRR